MSKLPYLQDKHLERMVLDNKPSETSDIFIYLLNPFNAAIEAVEAARKSGATIAPGDIAVDTLDEMLPVNRIMNFHKDLLRALLGSGFNQANPVTRFEIAVSRIKYLIWKIPQTVLMDTYRKTEFFLRAEERLSAMECLMKKIGAADESTWTREELAELLRKIMADPEFTAICIEGDEKRTVYRLLRWALVALEQGMPLADTMEILGKEETLRRLKAAHVHLQEMGGLKGYSMPLKYQVKVKIPMTKIW